MIVGREQEIAELQMALESKRPEFVVLYGRRRVGKTYLIDNVYRDEIVFRHAGLPSLKTKPKEQLTRQLNAFRNSLSAYGVPLPKEAFQSWMEAFSCLKSYLDSFPASRRVVVFLDEVPWMDTVSSHFVDALSDLWSNFVCFHDNVLLAVTGSASSWILDNLVQSTTGFYRRVTHAILLKPFTLAECEKLLRLNGLSPSRYEIAEIYMAVGGIPYYLNYFLPGVSVAQNIDRIFFGDSARLQDEFTALFDSQFVAPRIYESLVRALAKKSIGLSAAELGKAVKLETSGSFYEMLRALKRSRIIQEYSLFGESKRDTYFKLVDPFCYFYLKQVEPHQSDSHYYENHANSSSLSAYRGYAFELLCFDHIDAIKKAMSVLGVASSAFPFSQRDEGMEAAQIDLVLRRGDNVVNLCEAKWSGEEFAMNKAEHLALERKKRVLGGHLLKRESIRCVLLTTFGLKRGEYFSDFSNIITLDDLFS